MASFLSALTRPDNSSRRHVWLNKAGRFLVGEGTEQPDQSLNTAEAFLLPLIEELEHRQPKLTADYPNPREKAGQVIKEVRKIMDYFGDEKLEEGSMISCLLADTVDIAHHFLDFNRFFTDSVDIFFRFLSVLEWVIEVQRRIIQFHADGANINSATRSDEVGGGDEECAVGLEEDVRLLLRTSIFHKGRGLKISFVRGMVGIGKTTLARQLYNHADVIDRFKCRAWVCVSTKLSHREVFMRLIQQVADSKDFFQRDSLLERMKHADNRTLREMLYKYLKGLMPYLIVIDDFPAEMNLEYIWESLPSKGKESRVLITTRILELRQTGRAHDMKFLDPDKSWQMFLKTIFHGNNLTSDDKFPKGLERRARNLLTKCGGLPLAIKDVGEQVANMRRSGIEWEEVLESIDFDSVLALLEPSYQKFSRELRLCFLNLGFFKENAIVKVKKLFRLWEIGGIIVSRLEHDMRSYVKELIDESVVEVHKAGGRYEIKSCRINAVLHRLSIKKAVEEIGFEIISSNGNNGPSLDPRHRVIYCSRDKFNHFTDGDKHLISLFFRGGGCFDTSPSYWKSLGQLRILELEDFGLSILPEGIGTLMELRYLGLRSNYVQELPDSLGCLEHLEVLDIARNFMVEIPDIIWEMGSLRHIYMSDVICRKPFRTDALRSLETLTYISAEDWTYEVLDWEMLSNLYELGIEELDENSDVSKLFESLAKLGYLRSLILRGFRFRSMPCLDELGNRHCLTHVKIDGLLAMLPRDFPEYLESLKLVNSRLDEDPMPVLEKLPYLLHLELRNAYTGQQMVISRRGFPELQGLCIEESWNLRNIQVGKRGMSKLEKLEIKNCPHLETLPQEMRSMTHLKQIRMVTNKHAAAKIRNSALISKFEGAVDINYIV